MEQFKKARTKASNVKEYQFWRHDNKPIELWNKKVIQEKINYTHNNPVVAGLVYFPEDYVYSSAADYAERKGLLDNVIVFEYFGCKKKIRLIYQCLAQYKKTNESL